MNAAAAARALGGEALASGEIVAPGPGHSARDRSLSVKIDPRAPGGFLVFSFAGDPWEQCRDHVRDRLGLGRDRPEPPPLPRPAVRPEPDRRGRTRRALQIWAEAGPIAGTLAARYFAGRGLDLGGLPDLGHAVRWHGCCPWGRDRVPCIVALMTCPLTGEPTGVQRTALADDGTKIARKMLGRAGVVRLSPEDCVETGLGLVEGTETGLSVLASGWRPVWACLSAGSLARFPVLAGIEAITVFADADEAGIGAAETCAARWADAGREARVHPAPEPGSDFEREAG